jgi:hypothetical protein
MRGRIEIETPLVGLFDDDSSKFNLKLLAVESHIQ